jgi:poly(A) polymerase
MATYDIDFATNLPPDLVIVALNKSNIKVIPTGLKHGTITAIINKDAYEITTLRCDTKCDGRHAEIKFTSSWKEDAARRDLTFNALYCDLEGNLYDYFGGVQDLENKLIRFVGNTEERIKEDYLRILRAFRFYAYIPDAVLDNKIMDACSKFASNINFLSGERIKQEMMKLLQCPNLMSALKAMSRTGLLSYVTPGKLRLDRLDVLLGSGLEKEIDPLLRLAIITDHSSYNYIIKRWKLSKKEKKILLTLGDDKISSKVLAGNSDLAENLDKELQHKVLLTSVAKGKISVKHYKQLESFIHSYVEFPIKGKDLLQAGMRPGKELGKILELLRRSWESSNFKLSKEELLNYARSIGYPPFK